MKLSDYLNLEDPLVEGCMSLTKAGLLILGYGEGRDCPKDIFERSLARIEGIDGTSMEEIDRDAQETAKRVWSHPLIRHIVNMMRNNLSQRTATASIWMFTVFDEAIKDREKKATAFRRN